MSWSLLRNFVCGTIEDTVAVKSSLDVTNAWMSVSAAVNDSEGNVKEMEEGYFGDVVEGGVKDNSKVGDLGRGSNSRAINVACEILGGAGKGVWAND